MNQGRSVGENDYRFAKLGECCRGTSDQQTSPLAYVSIWGSGIGGFYCENDLWCDYNNGNSREEQIQHVGKLDFGTCVQNPFTVPENNQAWQISSAGDHPPPSGGYGDYEYDTYQGGAPMLPAPGGGSPGTFPPSQFQGNDDSDSVSGGAHSFNPTSGPPSFQPSQFPSQGGSGIGNPGGGLVPGRNSVSGPPSSLQPSNFPSHGGIGIGNTGPGLVPSRNSVSGPPSSSRGPRKGGRGAGNTLEKGRKSLGANPFPNMWKGDEEGTNLGNKPGGTSFKGGQSSRGFPGLGDIDAQDEEDGQNSGSDDSIAAALEQFRLMEQEETANKGPSNENKKKESSGVLTSGWKTMKKWGSFKNKEKKDKQKQ